MAKFFCLDPNDERKVIVKRLALCVKGRPDMELDLTKPLDELKKQVSFLKVELDSLNDSYWIQFLGFLRIFLLSFHF